MKLPYRIRMLRYWSPRRALRFAWGRFVAWAIVGGHTCDRCGTGWGVKRLHMNTAYVDKESNWTHQCPPCYEKTEEEWAELWAVYWAGRL